MPVYGDIRVEWIKEAMRHHAWQVLTYQLSQASPELRQRLLHRAGTIDYGGSNEYVSALLDSGAQADGIALANGVFNCRPAMVNLLLDRGVATNGKYTGEDDTDVNDDGEEKFSLLSLAAIVHCDSAIRLMLIAHGADPKDIDPVLQRMQSAIAADDPARYEAAWKACSATLYCRSRGWNPASLHDDYGPTEDAWVDDAIMERSWRVVAIQLTRASLSQRDELLSSVSACYPNRPELIKLLNAEGSVSDGDQMSECPRGAPVF